MAVKDGNVGVAVEVNKIFLRSSILNFCNFDKLHAHLWDTLDASGGIGGKPATSYSARTNLADGQDFLWDGFSSDANIDETNTTLCVDNEDFISKDRTDQNPEFISHRAYNCEVLDQFNDSSIDATIWSTSGTVSEDTEKINIGGSAGTDSLISDGASGFDARSFSADSEVILHFNGISAASTSNFIQISNGSTHVTLHSVGAGAVQCSTVRIAIDKSAENAYVSINDGAFGGAIDISSVTTNWYLRFTTNTNTSSRLRIYFIGFLDGSSGTVDYVSVSKTFPATKTDAILTWDYDGTDSDIAGNISSDGGSNYTSATKNIWTAIGTQSTSGKVKLVCTLPTSITGDGTVKNIKGIRAVGAYFNG